MSLLNFRKLQRLTPQNSVENYESHKFFKQKQHFGGIESEKLITQKFLP